MKVAAIFSTFPGFARLSFWQEQHIDDDKYGALVD
jgi:hypothetical protein